MRICQSYLKSRFFVFNVCSILKLLEGGFIERWRREHWPTDECGIKEKFVESRSITLEDLSGNFSALLIGIVLSVLALLFEVAVRKCKHTLANRNCMNLNQSDSSVSGAMQFQDGVCANGVIALKTISGESCQSNDIIHSHSTSNGISNDIVLKRQSMRIHKNGIERIPSGHSNNFNCRTRKGSLRTVTRNSHNIDVNQSKSPLELL